MSRARGRARAKRTFIATARVLCALLGTIGVVLSLAISVAVPLLSWPLTAFMLLGSFMLAGYGFIGDADKYANRLRKHRRNGGDASQR